MANEQMTNQMGRGATAAALFSSSFQKEQVLRAILCLDLPSDSQVVFYLDLICSLQQPNHVLEIDASDVQ